LAHDTQVALGRREALLGVAPIPFDDALLIPGQAVSVTIESADGELSARLARLCEGLPFPNRRFDVAPLEGPHAVLEISGRRAVCGGDCEAGL